MSGAVMLKLPATRRAGSALNDPADPARRKAGLPLLRSRIGEPTWEIAERMYPRQGAWTEEEYFRLRPSIERTVEFVRGFLDFHGEVRRESALGEPTWEVAEFAHPRQGAWTEEEYLEIEDACLGKVEFAAGALEFLTLPDLRHARLCQRIADLFRRLLEPVGRGEVLGSELTCKVLRGHPRWEDRDRIPDMTALRPHPPLEDGYPLAAGLLAVAEVVSPDRESVERDHVVKRTEYAAAGIPEYWIIDGTDPEAPFVLVLTLPDGTDEYVEHGTFRPGETATSPTYPDLRCDVAALFAAAEG